MAEVGGVTDDRISTFTDYIVAFNGAEKTKSYQKAAFHDLHGHMVMLTEEQFFDVIEGKANPPEPKVLPKTGGLVIPAKAEFAEQRRLENERVKNYVLGTKQLKSMATHGVPLEDGGIMRVNFGASVVMKHMVEVKKAENISTESE